MKSEARVQQDIRLAASSEGIRLFRNNSGAVTVNNPNGGTRHIRFGLGNESTSLNKSIKSSDLIGVTPIVIGAEHIGMTLGVFTAYEVKEEGWKFTGNEREIAQKKFIDLIIQLGGIAKFTQGEL